MTACADLAVVLLAAGRSVRFGANKLEADLGGKMLGLHAAETIGTFNFGCRIAVLGRGSVALGAKVRAMGFEVIDNAHPKAGLSHSLVLAVTAALETNARGLLVCLADMPFVTPGHIDALVRAFHERGKTVASASGDVSLPPALFPRVVWPQLMTLAGDRGASELLKSAQLVSAPPRILRDIDTQADLELGK